MAISKVNTERREIFERKRLNSSFWYLKSWLGVGQGMLDILKYRIKDISIPYTQLETKTAISGQRYITDVELEGEFDISFYETPNFEIHDFLLSKRTALFNNENLYFVPSSRTQFSIAIYSFDDNGKLIEIKNHVFSEVIILGIQQYSLDIDSNAPLITTVKCIANSIFYSPDDEFYEKRKIAPENFSVKSFRENIFKLKFQNASFWRLEWDNRLNSRIKSLTIPYTLLSTESSVTGQRYIKGVTLEEDFTMSFYEDDKYTVHDTLLKLRLSFFDNSKLKFKLNGYQQFSVIFYHYDDEGKEVVSKKAIFDGVIVKGLETYALDYESNSPVLTGITAVANSIAI